MRPFLDNFSFVKDKDAVHAGKGGETVRNDKGGAVRHDVSKTVLNETFGKRIKRRGGFVKNENGGVG